MHTTKNNQTYSGTIFKVEKCCPVLNWIGCFNTSGPVHDDPAINCSADLSGHLVPKPLAIVGLMENGGLATNEKTQRELLLMGPASRAAILAKSQRS